MDNEDFVVLRLDKKTETKEMINQEQVKVSENGEGLEDGRTNFKR